MADENKVVCIFVHRGYEVDRVEMDHPGMNTFEREWTTKIPNPRRPDQFREEKQKADFYWDHMDMNGCHIFRSHEHSTLEQR